jgi:hypothetical protein
MGYGSRLMAALPPDAPTGRRRRNLTSGSEGPGGYQNFHHGFRAGLEAAADEFAAEESFFPERAGNRRSIWAMPSSSYDLNHDVQRFFSCWHVAVIRQCELRAVDGRQIGATA